MGCGPELLTVLVPGAVTLPATVVRGRVGTNRRLIMRPGLGTVQPTALALGLHICPYMHTGASTTPPSQFCTCSNKHLIGWAHAQAGSMLPFLVYGTHPALCLSTCRQPQLDLGRPGGPQQR